MSDVDKLDPDDTRPPYQQVADRLRERIANGEYVEGAKLPGHQAVADEFGVSIGTVKRAFSLLQQERLIFTRQGQGSYVRASSDGDESHAETGSIGRLEHALDSLARRVDEIERRLANAER